VIYTLPDGRWYDAAAERWISGDGEPVPAPGAWELLRVELVQVQLGCAHLDHDPSHNSELNLAALCQRCHLAHDAPHHAARRRITFRLRYAIGDLFGGLYRR
jgi:hypothetical protein